MRHVTTSTWKVGNGDKTLIALANKANAGANITAAGACTGLPATTPDSTGANAVTPPPSLVCYQVRGACSYGVEGL